MNRGGTRDPSVKKGSVSSLTRSKRAKDMPAHEIETVTRFVELMASIDSRLLKLSVVIQKLDAALSVSRDLIPTVPLDPSKQLFPEYAERSVTVTFTMHAVLKDSDDPNRSTVGLEVMLCHRDEGWVAEGEIGWSGRDIGWDSFEEKSIHQPTFEAFCRDVPAFVSAMCEDYKAAFDGKRWEIYP